MSPKSPMLEIFSGSNPKNISNMGDFGNIFESFFEGLGVRPHRKTYERGSDLEIQEEISLEEAFRGTTKTLHLRTFVRCEKCKGKGAEASSGFEKCPTCEGGGEVLDKRRNVFG